MILNGGFMKRYIEIFIGGKRYRFLIDEELDKTLKVTLKDRYKFDSNNTLVVENDDLVNYYNLKQLILKSILNQVSAYDLTPDLQRKIDLLKGYVGSRNTVYSSDLTKIDSIIGEASEIYSGIRANLPKKEIAEEQREQIKDNLDSIKDIANSTNYEDVSETISNSDDKLEEFKTIIEEIADDEGLKNEIPVNDINGALDRVVICSSMEEFIDKTNSNVNSYDIVNAIKNKSEKIIFPPNTKLEDVTVEILKTCINDNNIMNKVVTYVERKALFKNKTDSAFESLRSSLKISGLSSRNLNFFGDQFFSAFESICNESGVNFESMFADYFNSYSANRKYNSPMDKFIRLFNKFNGGNDNTRSLLEAMLVKKAISRGLISRKYNSYLKDEYRNLNVNSNGYINFNESSFINTTGGISEGITGTSDIEGTTDIESSTHVGLNNNSYETDLIGDISKKSAASSSLDGVKTTKNDSVELVPDSAILNATMAQNRRNRIGAGIVNAQNSGKIITTQLEKTNRATGLNGRRFTSNNGLNPALIDEDDDILEDEIDDETSQETQPSSDGLENTSINDSNNGNNYSGDSDEEDNQADEEGSNNLVNDNANTAKDAVKNVAKESAKKAIIEFIKKNPWVWGAVAVIFLVIFIILVIMASSNDSKMQGLGYYDSACNFNATKVIVSSCESSGTLQNLELKDYVTRMTYLYTKDGNYSDETIKALMIILKTNALSLGRYSNGSKSVNVKICDVYSGTVDENNLFSGVDESLEKLNSLYEQISEYLFISETYKSSISSLGSVNAITIDENILTSLENAGSTYTLKLDSVFKVDTEENITISDARENLFLGDSRTHGMLLTSVINDGNTVYGDGYGYNWLVGSSGFNGTTNASNGGINGINSKIIDGKSYNIIIWLGVNDLGNVNSYLEKYIDLASSEWSRHNIYVVSVGPVDDNKSQYAKNETINAFNNTMKDGINNANLNNLKYVDLGYSESSISSYDNAGVHYSNTDYRNIYTKITSNVISGPSSISTKLSLYKLSDYCTYYSLTENDAYWWPIGSKEPTRGNIYGGTPISTYISSPFGMRIHPKTGQYKKHTGVDIAGVDTSSPVIATKNGTVISVKDGCTSTTCTCSSGGYGNNIKIDHGDGVVSLYAHLSSVSVKVGDVVEQGQKIGMVGTTGCSTGNHLHFEIQLNGTQVNPMDYINAKNTRPVNSINANVTGTEGDYKNMVCSSLLASGFSKEATIGIMANLVAESGYSPINLQDSYESKLGYNDTSYTLAVDNGSYNNFSNDRAGYGLVQWTSGGRKLNLYNYAKERNVSIGNFEMQFNFMLRELQNSYSNTYKYITANHSTNEIGAYWCDHYESPSGSEPCSIHGNCPSQKCVNRTAVKIKEGNLIDYVNNGCKN